MEGYAVVVGFTPGQEKGKERVSVTITDTSPSRNFLYRGSMEFEKALEFMKAVKNVSDVKTLFDTARQFGLESIER